MLQDKALGFCTHTGTYWGKDAERYVKVQFHGRSVFYGAKTFTCRSGLPGGRFPSGFREKSSVASSKQPPEKRALCKLLKETQLPGTAQGKKKKHH